MKFGTAGIARPLTGQPNLSGKYPVPKVSNSSTTAAPVGGLNARDAIANMDPTDAIKLVNFFPSTLGCQVRNGYLIYGKGYPGPVETVATHAATGTQEFLYAFATTNMYDATSGGPPGTAMLTGLSNARWQWVNFATTSGVYWIGVNGVDNPIMVSPGRVVSRLTIGNGTDANTISGVDPKTFTSVTVHQKRLWFTITNSPTCYYLPAGAMWGVASSFNFGVLWKKGGVAMCQVAWTVDSGDGPDDRLCTISTAGEVTVYTGTDPSTTATWQLNGVFYIGRPIGVRCTTKFGGDVAVICDQGLASLNSILTSTTVNTRTSFFSDKIQTLISDEIGLWYSKFGWQPHVYPMKNMLILNVPDGNISIGLQLVMNTLTGAWTTFQGYKALNWTNLGPDCFFGTSDGQICKGLYGYLDGTDSAAGNPGSDIDCMALTAFNYFTLPGADKNYTLVRPNLVGINQPAVALKVNMAFDLTEPPQANPASNVGVPIWDTEKWDNGMWTAGARTFNDWYDALGISYAAALGLRLKVKDQISWASTDWVFQVQKGTAI